MVGCDFFFKGFLYLYRLRERGDGLIDEFAPRAWMGRRVDSTTLKWTLSVGSQRTLAQV